MFSRCKLAQCKYIIGAHCFTIGLAFALVQVDERNELATFGGADGLIFLHGMEFNRVINEV